MRTWTRARDEWMSEELEHSWIVDDEGVKLAHELKNPLSAVKALAQLGLHNPAESASHERLATLEREVTRMQKILMTYLSSPPRKRECTPERVDLAALVADALQMLRAQADSAGVRLSSRGEARVEADPRRIREALLCVLANGIEASAAGGEVAVEVRRAGDQVEILVHDTGRGMSPETLRRIGTPFFTTRENGSGLGVALARSVVAQHGGSLHYESEQGKGTTVRVTLPGRTRQA